MESFYYILLGLFWIIVCVGLGLYINGKGFLGKKQHTLGLKSIVVSYLIGICMLFAIIVFS